MNEETVTILKSEYDQMLEDVQFLDALLAAGVDNWSGYDQACQMVGDNE